MNVTREKFFNCLRELLGGRLNSKQVESAEAILRECEKLTLPAKQIAYIFATAIHETARTLEPIRERRARKGTLIRAQQDRYWPSGFYGRGFVQITWRRNYELVGQKIGVDLVGNPDLALEREIAAKILVQGMSEGWFTGRRLNEFINERRTDYRSARRVVNGLDRADEIAELSKAMERCIELRQLNAVSPPTDDAAVITAPPPTGFLKKLRNSLGAAISAIGGIAGIREAAGIQLSDDVMRILEAAIPMVITIGFTGLVIWYIAEKIIGWKTLKLQAEIAVNRKLRDIEIKKQ